MDGHFDDLYTHFPVPGDSYDAGVLVRVEAPQPPDSRDLNPPGLELQARLNSMFTEKLSAVDSISLTERERMNLFHNRLREMPKDTSTYCDPKFRTLVPYPYPGTAESGFNLDPERFCFEFMGRERFETAYSEIGELIDDVDPTKRAYLINGSSGWGKSYLLAAVASVLLAQGKKVIYVPDSGALMHQGLDYFKRCFYMAYANDEDKLQRIVTATSYEELCRFIYKEKQAGIRLLFLLDQADILGLKSRKEITSLGDTESRVREILLDNMSQHAVIACVSMNSGMSERQPTSHELSLPRGLKFTEGFYCGGLSEKEVAAWWHYHQKTKTLPDLLMFPPHACLAETANVESRRKEIEKLTGSKYDLLDEVLSLASEPVGPTMHLTEKQMERKIIILERQLAELKAQSTADDDGDDSDNEGEYEEEEEEEEESDEEEEQEEEGKAEKGKDNETPSFSSPSETTSRSRSAATPSTATDSGPHQMSFAEWKAERIESDAAFDRWVRERLGEIAADERASFPAAADAGVDNTEEGEERRLPDIFAGESIFPPMEDIPPEFWGMATESPQSSRTGTAAAGGTNYEDNGDDEKGPALATFDLNNGQYLVREKDLDALEATGLDCSELRERA
ncbi:hypothetical protein Dda_5389 [Drechslerella dactyloides]|uniref:Uncharacterized protein n=1 Tax=Drechslerella dactyloides TaxID=74499 RepID=A0AAD6NIN0_DREDA|nr:hypothetical protein Dda_5389 [Drechslerella dactyloides]